MPPCSGGATHGYTGRQPDGLSAVLITFQKRRDVLIIVTGRRIIIVLTRSRPTMCLLMLVLRILLRLQSQLLPLPVL